eukprot:scaffold921_cov397-Prasinococcus_capsulatus_cf.AAC.10
MEALVEVTSNPWMTMPSATKRAPTWRAASAMLRPTSSNRRVAWRDVCESQGPGRPAPSPAAPPRPRPRAPSRHARHSAVRARSSISRLRGCARRG